MFFAPPIRPKTLPMTWDQIIGRGAPRNANQPEAFRDVIFDSQTFVSAATTSLTFFGTLQTDKTLGNIPQAGSLPAATAFALSAITSEWLIGAEVGGVAGGNAVTDVTKLMVTGRPTFTLSLSDKTYGPWPLAYAGQAGGVYAHGNGTVVAADANAFTISNTIPNGGFFVGNTIILLPNVQFSITVNWTATQTLSGNRILRVGLQGTRYRRVV